MEDLFPPSEQLDVRLVIDPDPTDPGCLGIDGSLPPEQCRDTDPERPGDIRCCEVPSLLKLEHTPVTAAVLVAVDEPGNTAPELPPLKGDHLPAGCDEKPKLVPGT